MMGVSPAPMMGSAAMMAPSAYSGGSMQMVAGAPTMPEGLPAGARYAGSTQTADGGIIDRYAISKRAHKPMRQVIPEVQNYQVVNQTMVPETKQVQTPVQTYVDVEETIMVPETTMVAQKRVRMVPQQEMVTQQVVTQRPVQQVETRQRTVSKVVEGQKIVQNSQIIEYERPRVIPGRMIGAQVTGTADAGIQWGQSYYTGTGPAVAVQQQQPRVSYVTRQAPTQYVTSQAPTQYVTSQAPTQYVTSQAPTQYVTSQAPTQYVTQRVPGQVIQPGGYTTGYTTGYSTGPVVQTTSQVNPYGSLGGMPNYATQEGLPLPMDLPQSFGAPDNQAKSQPPQPNPPQQYERFRID